MTIADILPSFLHSGVAQAYAAAAALALASAVVLLRRPAPRLGRLRWVAIAVLAAVAATLAYGTGVVVIFQYSFDHPPAPVDAVAR